jgi:o-succinylbenzoate synthase
MIEGITLWRYRIPLVSPLQLKPPCLNIKPLTHREGIVLQWHRSNGITWSEVSPLPGFSKESLDEAESQLNQFLKSCFFQIKRTCDLQSLNSPINGKLYPSVRFGLEMGLMKLIQFNPEKIEKAPCIAGLITDECIDIKHYSDYPVIKVKVGRKSLKYDINNINNILQHINYKQILRLDSNQSWTLKQAKQFFSEVPTKQIEFIEEPLKTSHVELESYKYWSQEINVPFAFDEQVQNPKFELMPIPGLSTLVIKPMLTGLSRALEMADQAKRLGINIVISSSYETSLTLNFLYQLSAHIPNALPSGLGTFSQFKFDLIEPLELPCKDEQRSLLPLDSLEKVNHYGL